MPFDGVLGVENIDTAYMPTGICFAQASWAPALRAQLVLGEFGATDWRDMNSANTVLRKCWQHKNGFTLSPAPMDHAAVAEVEVGALLEKRDALRNGARIAEIVWQSDNPVDYWKTLLSLDEASKPATMAVIAAAYSVGQMVGMYFKDFFARARPAQLFPALMTVVPTPKHATYPSNHALQNELVGLLLLRVLPDPLVLCYGDAIKSLACRIGENREIAGVHFAQDTDAGRRIARWLDQTYLHKLGTMQGLLSEARSEWDAAGHNSMRNLPFLNGIFRIDNDSVTDETESDKESTK